MSELNGDKARFQRLRKAGLLRRDRARAVYAALKRQSAASQRPRDGEQSGGARGRLETLHPEKPEAPAEERATS
jgi:hypothetical protein